MCLGETLELSLRGIDTEIEKISHKRYPCCETTNTNAISFTREAKSVLAKNNILSLARDSNCRRHMDKNVCKAQKTLHRNYDSEIKVQLQ